MSENKIKVTATTSTKPVRVSVSTPATQGNVTFSQDTSAYNANLAQQWAVSENLVLGQDYSSKYYANKAKESATNANNTFNSIRDTYQDFQEETSNAFNELNVSKAEVLGEIDIAKTNAVDSINTTKTTILNDIEFVADGEKDEIKDLANLIKENAQDIASRTSFAMFDTVLKDHVLTYEESKGLALQGTYVYKNAIAGSRYGYPDFYAKCLEEYNEATATETVNGVTVKVHSNGHKFYDIANKTAIDNSFNSLGTAWFYGVDTENERIFLPRNDYFDQLTGDVAQVGKFIEAGLPNITGRAGDNLKNAEGAFYAIADKKGYPATEGSTNSTGFDASLSNPIYGKSDTVQPNAVKKLLYICVGNTVADTSWVDVVTQVQGGVKDIEEAKDEAIDELKNIAGGTVPLGFIGSAILGIDETLNLQRYLNGQIILQDQFKGFTKYLKRRIELYPSLACAEDEWQTEVTMSAFSQCGKFVIDDNAGTIRLPKVVNIQGLTDLSKLGEIVEAGLPNITGGFTDVATSSGGIPTTPTGAFRNTTSGTVQSYGGGGSRLMDINFNFNASLSNPIYGNSNTVQQEQIQYPYFIQVATGAETEDNIINEIELNNPFSLLDYKYSEYELNNLSWLRSNGQYNPKAVYPAVYDLLLKIYNGTETKVGVSVKLSTEEYTDYDFVLNTAEETFRLPVKVKLASGKAVVGNGVALGLTDGSKNYGVYSNTAHALVGAETAYGTLVPSNASNSSYIPTDNRVGITTDATKSGIETSDSDLYLYFYVGETVQNANLINAGRIEEHLHSLIPDNSSLIAGYGMPDYSAGVSKSINVNYIEATNGFLVIDYTNVNTYSVFQITINGTSFNFHQGYSGTDYDHCNVGFIPIPKNTTYKITIGTNIRARYFPCIGG